MLLPASSSEKHTWPAPYRKNLVPLPSPLRPHCPANQRLCLWHPLVPCNQRSKQVSDEDLKHIKDVMAHAWELDTHTTYTSGPLNYMVFCDQKSVPEEDRALASQLLIMSFVSTLTATYSGSAISNYVYGVQAWHLLHSMPWKINKPKLEVLLKAAKKLTPMSSRRQKRHPYTVNFMLAIWNNMDLSSPLGASVFACLATCFFATGHVGEFTVQRLDGFNPRLMSPELSSAMTIIEKDSRQPCCIYHTPKSPYRGKTYAGQNKMGPWTLTQCWPTILKSTTHLRTAISSHTATRTDTDPSQSPTCSWQN